MLFFPGGVNDISYGCSPTEQHDNPSAQRQFSVSSLGKVVGSSVVSLGVLAAGWEHPRATHPTKW